MMSRLFLAAVALTVGLAGASAALADGFNSGPYAPRPHPRQVRHPRPRPPVRVEREERSARVETQRQESYQETYREEVVERSPCPDTTDMPPPGWRGGACRGPLEVTLSDDFLVGGGGVGGFPNYGGGGGGGVVFVSSGASASASARVAVNVSVNVRARTGGGGRGHPHPRGGGGCGCR